MGRQLQAAEMARVGSSSLDVVVVFNWLCSYNNSSIHGEKLYLKCVIVFRLQKLALRNNSASTTQHLRLLVRGQDQDCFQVRRVRGFLCLLSGSAALTYADPFVLLPFKNWC